MGLLPDLEDDVFENILPLVYHPMASPISDYECMPTVDEHVRLLDEIEINREKGVYVDLEGTLFATYFTSDRTVRIPHRPTTATCLPHPQPTRAPTTDPAPRNSLPLPPTTASTPTATSSMAATGSHLQANASRPTTTTLTVLTLPPTLDPTLGT